MITFFIPIHFGCYENICAFEIVFINHFNQKTLRERMGTILTNLIFHYASYVDEHFCCIICKILVALVCISQDNVFSLIYNILQGLFDSVWRNVRPFHWGCEREAVMVWVNTLPGFSLGPRLLGQPLMLHACLCPHTGVNVILMAVKCAQTSRLL